MIKLVRVDHRLLHGQVIFSWTKQMSVNYIIVADDKVPNDPISVMALNIAKPVDCELSIIPFSQLKRLVEEKQSKNIMILVKGPEEALRLIEKSYQKLLKSIMVEWLKNQIPNNMEKQFS